MEIEKRMILHELHTNNFLKTIASIKAKRFSKDSASSENARKEGNKLYVSSNHSAQIHEEIFRLYSKSIALAPNESEDLAIAYGNRSALLLHLEKYKESIEDINSALKITQSDTLKKKLHDRKSECLKAIDIYEVSQEENEEDFKLFDNFNSKVKQNNSQQTNKDFIDQFSELNLHEPCPDSVKKNKEKIFKFLSLKEKEDSFNSVKIKYNEKFGRHLVATREIKPGEIIFIEKPYVTCLDIKKPYTYCCHCLCIAWTSIPCNHCGWFMFCSKKCKEEAWTQYHEIECCCIPYIAHYLNFINNQTKTRVCFDGLSIRALIKGLKETGNFEKLKSEVENIEHCTDKQTKGFSRNGKFESNKFRSLFSLSCEISSDEIKSHVTFSTVAVICLAKYTSFFGQIFEFSEIEKLTKNSDFLFVGALILKLSKISNVNSHAIINVNDNCKFNKDVSICRSNWCCCKGVCIAPIASLTNNSCNPNARRCFTIDSKFILYALQPIKKNSQICDSYYCTFFEASRSDRQQALKNNFNFLCDCIACKDDWFCWPITDNNFEDLLPMINITEREFEEWNKYQKLIESVERESVFCDQKVVNNISEAISKVFKYCRQPSALLSKFIFTLIQAFERVYGYKLQTFNECLL